MSDMGSPSKKSLWINSQGSTTPKGSNLCREIGRIQNYALGGVLVLGLIYAYTRVPLLLGKASVKCSKFQNLHVFFKHTPREAHGSLRHAKTGPMSHIRRENDKLLGSV